MADTEPHDGGLPDDEEASSRWLPVTGPLSPARAAVMALALEQAGIGVEFLDAEQHTFPTARDGPPLGGQQLAVQEHQVEAAREVVARTHTAFADETTTPAPRPELDPTDTPPEGPPAVVSEEERAAEAAFEALRVRRYTQGLIVFVIGLVWMLAVLPNVREDALMAIIGVVILCAGLFRIYAALSLRMGEPDDAEDRDDDPPPEEPPHTGA